MFITKATATTAMTKDHCSHSENKKRVKSEEERSEGGAALQQNK